MSVKWMGWKPSSPDKRDFRFSSVVSRQRRLPKYIDLSGELPPVYNQGEIGSCTSFATCGLMQALKSRYGKDVFDISELYLYYFTRKIEGTVNIDGGATIRNAMKAAKKFGVPHEIYWKYDTSRVKVKPSTKSQFYGKHYGIDNYMRLNQNIHELHSCLAQGFPFVFGYMVFDSSLKLGKDGLMPMPDIRKEKIHGGHAVLCVGIDIKKKLFKCRNSWGKAWGDEGYFYMPFEYMLDPELSMDFWTARDVKYPSGPVEYQPPKPKPKPRKRKRVRRNICTRRKPRRIRI